MLEGQSWIRNEKYASQLRDFRGMRHGTIMPTDIDGLTEYHNKGFIYYEVKFRDAELPLGQRLALQRICDDHKKPCVAVVLSHNTPAEQAIDMADCTVTEYYSSGVWRKPQKPVDAKTFQESFIRHLDSL